MAEPTRIVTATARKYFKGASDLTKRNRLLLSEVQRRGLVEYNVSGDACYWDVEYSQPVAQTHGVSAEYIFVAHDALKQLSTDWRGYVMTNKLHKKERLMNRGSVALVEYYLEIMPMMRKSMDAMFHGELYGDGSSDTLKLHGLLTFLKFSTCATTDRVAQPSTSATYGGLDIELGAFSGSWSDDLGSNQPNSTISKDWPDGQGTSDYDFMAPLGVNDNASTWGTDSTDFEDNAWRVIEQAVDWQVHRCGEEGRPDVFMFSSDKFTKYKRNQEARFRNIIPHKEANDLGFRGTLNQDGVMMREEFDVPSGQIFGICFDKMELACMTEQLWDVDGPTYDIRTDEYLFKAGFWGNVRYQPKYFVLIKSFN